MDTSKLSNTTRLDPQELLRRARRAKAARLLGRGIAGSTAAVFGLQGIAACADDGTVEEDQGPGNPLGPDVPAPGVGEGKADWAHNEGERRPDMVYYDGQSWTEFYDCNTRAGCLSIDVILKVFVKPVAGANLDAKRIGAVFRLPSWEDGRTGTAMGSYFGQSGEFEEWHIRVTLKSWETPARAIIFNAWYQDGLGNTYYDDNNNEFHVAAQTNGYSYHPIIHHAYCCGDDIVNNVEVGDNGVTGTISLEVADLDYDKNIEIVWTTDDWATSNVFGLGSEHMNTWHWLRDNYSGFDLWQIYLDIPGAADKFEYAIVYKHGVVNDAKVYEFWDNNYGNNHVVTRRGTHYP